jgi:hypothetical protein
MTVFRDKYHETAFYENWCDRCSQPDEIAKRSGSNNLGCALRLTAECGAVPTQWTPRRNAAIGDAYKCHKYMDKPAVSRRAVAVSEDVPMFDVEA